MFDAGWSAPGCAGRRAGQGARPSERTAAIDGRHGAIGGARNDAPQCGWAERLGRRSVRPGAREGSPSRCGCRNWCADGQGVHEARVLMGDPTLPRWKMGRPAAKRQASGPRPPFPCSEETKCIRCRPPPGSALAVCAAARPPTVPRPTSRPRPLQRFLPVLLLCLARETAGMAGQQNDHHGRRQFSARAVDAASSWWRPLPPVCEAAAPPGASSQPPPQAAVTDTLAAAAAVP